MKNRRLILALLALVTLASCNDFNRLVKSTDNEMKYEVAMDYYDRGDYNHALQLFDLLQASFRNTPKGEAITTTSPPTISTSSSRPILSPNKRRKQPI